MSRHDPRYFFFDEVVLDDAVFVRRHNVAKADVVLDPPHVRDPASDTRQDHSVDAWKVMEKLCRRHSSDAIAYSDHGKDEIMSAAAPRRHVTEGVVTRSPMVGFRMRDGIVEQRLYGCMLLRESSQNSKAWTIHSAWDLRHTSLYLRAKFCLSGGQPVVQHCR